MWLRSENPQAFCAPILSAPMGPLWCLGPCGRCLLWDATCPDTLARHPTAPAVRSSRPALQQHWQNQRNCQKYATLSIAHEFIPVTIETLDLWRSLGLAFVNEVGRRISAVSGDPKVHSHSSSSAFRRRCNREMRRLFLEYLAQAHTKTPICLAYELCSDSVFELPSDWICVRFGRCTVCNYPVFDLSGDQ